MQCVTDNCTEFHAHTNQLAADSNMFECYLDGAADGFLFRIDHQILHSSSVKHIAAYCRAYLLKLTKKYCEQEIGRQSHDYEKKRISNCNETSESKDENKSNSKDAPGFKPAKVETPEMAKIRQLRKKFVDYAKQSDILIKQALDEIREHNQNAMTDASDCVINTFDEYIGAEKRIIPCNVYFDIEFVNVRLNLNKYEIWGERELKKSASLSTKYIVQANGITDPIALHLKVGKWNSRVIMDRKGYGTVHEIEFPENLFPAMRQFHPRNIWCFSLSEMELARMHVQYQNAMSNEPELYSQWPSIQTQGQEYPPMLLDNKGKIKKGRKTKWKPSVDVDAIAMNMINSAYQRWITTNVDRDTSYDELDDETIEEIAAPRRMFAEYITPNGSNTVFQLATPLTQYEQFGMDAMADMVTAGGVNCKNTVGYTFVYPNPDEPNTLHVDTAMRMRPVNATAVKLANNATQAVFEKINGEKYRDWLDKAYELERASSQNQLNIQTEEYAKLYFKGMYCNLKLN